MFGLLRRNRRFARLWTGESISILGDQVTALALPMIAIMLLHAAAWQLGVLTAASWVPYLGALFIGSAIDSVPSKRIVLVISDLVRAAALATIPLSYLLHRLSIMQLLVVAAVVGVAAVVSQTAYASFFPRIVESDDFMTANSLSSTARSVAGLGGPPAAGWLIQAVSAPVALLTDCCSYLVSAVAILGLRIAEPRPAGRSSHVARGAVDGLRILLRNPWLSSILWCTSLMNLANFAITAVVLIFATRTLQLTPAGIGTAQGIGAVGALIGALLAARLSTRIGIYPVVVIGTVMFSLPFLAFASIPADTASAFKISMYAGSVFLVTGAIMLYDININSVMFKVMPDDMRSRLVGAFSSINYGIRPVGAVLGGLAAEAIGSRATIVAAALLGLTAVLPLLGSPLRRARSMADVRAPDPVTG